MVRDSDLYSLAIMSGTSTLTQTAIVMFVERWPDLGDNGATHDVDNSSRRRSDDSRHWAKTDQVLNVTWVERKLVQTEEKGTDR